MIILDLIIGILEVFVLVKLFNTQTKIQELKLIVCSTILILVRTFEMIFIDKNSFNQIGLFCIIAMIILITKQPILRRIYNCIFIYVSYILSTVVVQFVMSWLIDNDQQSEFLKYLPGAIISKLLLLLFIVIFVKSTKENSNLSIPKYLYIPLISFQGSTILIIFMLEKFMSKAYQPTMLIITFTACIVLSISNILLFSLLEYYIKQAAEKEEILLIKTIDEYKVSYYKELAQKQKVSNKAVHDLKNQLFSISKTLDSDKEKAAEQINEICKNVFSSNFLSLTKIDAVDALISSKCQIMQAQNIRFNPSIFVETKVGINEMELCVLLGNLLDNAIEANEKVDDLSQRFIDLNIKQQNSYLSIVISNATNLDNDFQSGNNFPTSKKDKVMHGFGIKSIEEIAQRLGGNCIFKCENGVFTVTIMLLSSTDIA